ncbi:fibronectin type III domain-containing protein [Nonomuraea sp. NN258]|nr:fibronectin type III domain-containing protein [Nonomuraea antri]
MSARSGAGRITVGFSPSRGGTVERYTLKASGPGAAEPQSVSADGPFQFEFTGGDCAREYTFVVIAHWSGGEVESEASAGARPCVAPGAPTGFTAKAKNRGAELSWKAPENADDATTYELSGAAANPGIKGTSFTVDGLKNNQKHAFTLKAKNGAGESQDVATAEVDLAYPRGQYKNANNNQTDTIVRPGASKTGEAGRIAKGQYLSITVICQIKGQSVTESETNETSDVWNRIEWNGGVAYLSDTLMTTPRGAFPAAPLFECTD